MERWQVCGRLASDCHMCLEEDCFYIIFEKNHRTCVDQLNGWRDIQRIIAPLFPELCDRLSTDRPSVANIIQENSGMGFEWFLLFLDIMIILMMLGGFFVLFMRDRRIFRAIGEIPEQIRVIHYNHNRNNNYYLQLRQQGEQAEAEYNQEQLISNPFLQQPQALLPPTTHENIEMEAPDSENSQPSSSSSLESSPEAMPRENYVTRFNRLIKKPNFFRGQH